MVSSKCAESRIGAGQAAGTFRGLSREPGAGREACRSGRTVEGLLSRPAVAAGAQERRADGGAARAPQRAPDHQALHHLVATSPWDDEAVLAAVRQHALTAMTAKSPIAAWIVDDTGFPKKGKHSVGVAGQYCGQ